MWSASAGARHAATASRTAVYPPRRPERTVVYQVVQHPLETWLEATRGRHPDGEPVPRYIERDFRQYLTCGILAHGLPGRAARTVAMTSWSPWPARGGTSARRAPPGAWPRPQPAGWITCCPRCRCGRGCFRSRSGCAPSFHHRVERVNPVLQSFLAEAKAARRACRPGRTERSEIWRGDVRPPLRFGAERQPAFPLRRHQWGVPHGRRRGTAPSGVPDQPRPGHGAAAELPRGAPAVPAPCGAIRGSDGEDARRGPSRRFLPQRRGLGAGLGSGRPGTAAPRSVPGRSSPASG